MLLRCSTADLITEEQDPMAYAKDQAPVSTAALRAGSESTRPFDSVPVVDFAGMLGDDPAARRTVATQIYDACTRVGFFYLVNHGVAEDLVERAFSATRAFFDEPEAVKLRCDIARSAHACGYVPLLAEDGDLHEAFDAVAEDREIHGRFWPGDFRQAGNQWPEDMDIFRDTLTEYTDAMRQLARRMFGALALSLDLPDSYFAPLTDRPMSLLRILHYPSQDGDLPQGKVGAGAHTDHECFTILCPDDVRALQVCNGAGEWLFVPRIPGAFVVNVGDLLSRWTNDRFVSTLHRVVNVTGQERYSIPFFVGPNPDARIEALPSCVSADDPPRHKPVVAGDYVMANILASLDTPPSAS